VGEDDVGVHVGAAAAGENQGCVVLLVSGVLVVGDVGGGLKNDVFVVDPHGGDDGLVHDRIFGDDFGGDLVGPVDLDD